MGEKMTMNQSQIAAVVVGGAKTLDGDIRISNQGSIFMVYPLSDAGTEWLDEHIGEESTWFGGGLAVEHRYIEDLVEGMQGDGLTVS
jgi:hypothetical protein